MAESLAGTRDSLHALALYLLEMAARAQLAGSSTILVETTNYVSMAQVVFKSVIALEGVLGAPQPQATPVPQGPSSSGFDPNAMMLELTEQIRKQTEEIQKKAFEDLKRQYEEQQSPKPANPSPEPQPPVQG